MFKAKIFVFVSLLFAFNQVTASQGGALYNVKILVVDESAGVRWGAFKQGLDEVFVRISGDSIIMDKLKRPAPTTYVKQYSYEPVDKPTSNAKGELLSYTIKIQYNGSAMEKYLRDNGFPVWGEHRPEVVLWLTVRDGRNEYVLKSTDESLLKTAADKAMTRRGVPGKWPLYDNKDKKILKVADIRGGFRDPVKAASKRYTRGPALTGSMIWSGTQWQSNWSLLMKNSNRHWSLVDADYNRLISKAVDQAADTMGIVFAVHGSAGKQQLEAILLDVQAVSSIEKYRRLERYLNDLDSVAMVKPVRIDGQNVLFEVLLRDENNDFINVIKNDAKLAETAAPQVKAPVIPESAAEEEAPSDLKPPADDDLAGSGSNEADGEPQMPEDLTPVFYFKLIK